MTKDQVPEFVEEIIATGCPISAVGHDIYVFAEIDLPDDEIDRVVKEVHAVCQKYGERDHLRKDIPALHRSLFRFGNQHDSLRRAAPRAGKVVVPKAPRSGCAPANSEKSGARHKLWRADARLWGKQAPLVG